MIANLERKIWEMILKISPKAHEIAYKKRLVIKYIVAGGTAAVVDIGALYFFKDVLDLPLRLSVALAFLVGFTASFILQKFWAFEEKSTDRVHAQAVLYFIVSAVNFFLNIIFVSLLVEVFGLWYILAKIIVSGLIAFVSFFIYKIFIFKLQDSSGGLIRLARKKIPDLAVLFFVAVVVYGSFGATLRSFAKDQIKEGANPAEVFPVHGSDSSGYVRLADNLLNQGVFSSDDKVPFTPDTFRTPGYPLFIALIRLTFGSLLWVSVIQTLLSVCAAFIILKIGESLFGRLAGVVASFMYLLDPTVVFHSLVILSDIPFTFLILLSVYLGFFVKMDESSKWRNTGVIMFLSGLVLGFSILVRPISVFLPALFLPFFFFSVYRKVALKKVLITGALFALGVFVLVFPWIWRNKAVANTWGLSSVGSFNLFHYYVPEFLAYKEHKTPDEFRLLLRADLPKGVLPEDIGSIQHSKTLNEISLKYLQGNFFNYGIFHAVKTIPVFLSSGIKHFLYYFNDALHYEAFKLNKGNMTTLLLDNKFGDFWNELKASFVTTFESFYLFAVCLFALIPCFRFRKHFLFLSWFWILILYFALLTGSVAYARFRIPLAPFLFILGSSGVIIAYEKVGALPFFTDRKKI